MTLGSSARDLVVGDNHHFSASVNSVKEREKKDSCDTVCVSRSIKRKWKGTFICLDHLSVVPSNNRADRAKSICTNKHTTTTHTSPVFSLCVCVRERLQAPSVVVRPALTWPRPLLMVEHERDTQLVCVVHNDQHNFERLRAHISIDILLSLTIFLSVLFSILLLWLL